MLFAALLLLSPVPLFGNVVAPIADRAPVVLTNLPNGSSMAPLEKIPVTNDAAPATTAEPALAVTPQPKADVLAESSSVEPIAGQIHAFAFEPVKPATHRSYDNRNQKRLWYGLVAAGHAGAVFDAWSTRRALSGDYGTEGDPIMRPFAHSGTLYIATQVGPAVLDLIGRRAMVSEHPWVRKMWWVPQTVGATMSFRAGIHNVGVVPN